MEKFDRIAADAFKVSVSEIHDGLTPKDIPEWDSMTYLLLIAALEKEFQTSFGMDEVLNAQSLGDVRAVLVKKGLIV